MYHRVPWWLTVPSEEICANYIYSEFTGDIETIISQLCWWHNGSHCHTCYITQWVQCAVIGSSGPQHSTYHEIWTGVCHWNENIVILMKFSSLAALEVVILTTSSAATQIAKFMGPTWGPPGTWWPQVGPMWAPWILLSGQWCENFIKLIFPFQ